MDNDSVEQQEHGAVYCSMATSQIIKRGVIESYNSTTNVASVLLLEATAIATPQSIPAARNLGATVGDMCAVLFFDEHNYTDAVVIAAYPRQ